MRPSLFGVATKRKAHKAKGAGNVAAPAVLGRRPKPITIPMPNILGVVASQTATLQLPIGYAYHAIYLLIGGTFTLAQMTFRVIANGEVIQTFTGTVRNVINKFDKMPACAGSGDYLVIPFTQFGMGEVDPRYLSVIPTGRVTPSTPRPITDFRIEIDIGAATNPTLQAWAEVSEPDLHHSLFIPRIDTWQENVAATGEYLWNRRIAGDKLRPLLRRLAYVESVSNLTAFRILEENKPTWQENTALNEIVQQLRGTKSPQSGYVFLDPCDQGDITRVKNILHAKQLELRTTHSATNANLAVYMETLGRLAA